jgi:hypothetical protein
MQKDFYIASIVVSTNDEKLIYKEGVYAEESIHIFTYDDVKDAIRGAQREGYISEQASVDINDKPAKIIFHGVRTIKKIVLPQIKEDTSTITPLFFKKLDFFNKEHFENYLKNEKDKSIRVVNRGGM